MKAENTDKRMWTRVSEDGKSAAAGMSLGSGGETGGGIDYKLGCGGNANEAFSRDTGKYVKVAGSGTSNGPVYRGKVTLPNEVRRPVTQPAQTGKAAPPPASKPAPQGKVTWNSTLQPKPSENQLETDTREALHNVSEGKDLNVSSAYRPDKRTDAQIVDGKTIDPHADNRAVDINYVNGAHIADVANKGGPDDAELRRQVAEMQDKARTDPNVQAFISPYGGFFRTPGGPPVPIPADHPVLNSHRNHVHIAVFKPLQ